jgi:hypothetical protein
MPEDTVSTCKQYATRFASAYSLTIDSESIRSKMRGIVILIFHDSSFRSILGKELKKFIASLLEDEEDCESFGMDGESRDSDSSTDSELGQRDDFVHSPPLNQGFRQIYPACWELKAANSVLRITHSFLEVWVFSRISSSHCLGGGGSPPKPFRFASTLQALCAHRPAA